MKEKITKRFEELLDKGELLSKQVPLDSESRPHYWIPAQDIVEFQAWLFSTANLLKQVSLKDSPYQMEVDRLLANENMATGVPTDIVFKMLGLLHSAYQEWLRDFLSKLEYIVVAETFDEFLDHAKSYHAANKKIEASVLASAVFEDTIKRIATKNSLDSKKTLEPLVDSLKSNDVFTAVKAKRAKAYSGLRNKALHAEWDEFDIKDVGEMIKGIEEIIEEYL